MPATDATQAELGTDRRVVEVATLWSGSVLDVRQLDGAKRTETFSIGDDPGCDVWVMAETIGGRSRLPLVTAGPSGPSVSVPPGVGAKLRRDGVETSVAGPAEVPVEAGLDVEVTISELTFKVRQTDPGRIARGPATFDRNAVGWAGISLFAHATFLALVFAVPPTTESISLDTMVEGNRFVSYLIAPPEMPEPTLADIVPEEPAPTEAAAAGDAHEGPEGQAGRPDAPDRDTRFGIRDRGLERIQMGRERMRDLAATSGILAVLRSEAPVSPFGAEIPNGVDAEDALGHLMGRDVGAAFGYGGLGMRGTGRGGGGIDGGIGFGRLRTIGDRIGPGTGGTCYGCRQARELRSRRSSGPTVRMGVVSTSGALSSDVIRRRIRQHRNAIRHCYERELQHRPDLSGRVAIRFVIGQDGTVVSSTVASNNVGSTTVGECVSQAIRRVSFPPPGQGVVIVTYPFTFIHD